MDEASRELIARLRAMEADMPTSRYGYLDDEYNVVVCKLSDLFERYDGRDPWVAMKRRIIRHTRIGTFSVSTIFLVFDHSFPLLDRHPLWFETMVFRSGRELYQDRYETYADAIAGHYRAVTMTHAAARWLGYSQSHLRKIRREQRAHGIETCPALGDAFA
jgi:hypothetical protein